MARYPQFSKSCVRNAMLGLFLQLGTVMAPATANAEFQSFDLPNGWPLTYPYSINGSGEITGYYLSSEDMRIHAFVRSADGNVTSFEAPGSGTGFSQGTYGFSINDDGAVTGSYTDDEYYGHGFVRKPNGKIVEFDAGGNDTNAMSINANGWVTGSYSDEGIKVYGFLRAPDGKVTTLSVPESAQPLSINSRRHITGWYESNYFGVGFLTSRGGRTKVIDCPNAVSTIPQSINDQDVVTGYCGAGDGFVRHPDRTFVVFQPLGATSTQAISINGHGDVVGFYTKSVVNESPNYGFVRFADGKIKSFSVPGAGRGRNEGTWAEAINNSGIVTGFYIDSQEHSHGFVGTP